MSILLKSYAGKAWRSRFARNVAVMATGTAAAQAISFLFAPLIARLYGPEAFGLQGVFTAMMSVAITVAALAYPIAIVLPREESEAKGMVRLSAITACLIVFVMTVAVLVGGDWIAAAIGVEAIKGYLLLLPVAVFFSVATQIAQQWLIRSREYKIIAKSSTAQSLFVNGAKSAAGMLHPTAPILIVLTALGGLVHAVLLYLGARRSRLSISHAKNGTYTTPLMTLAWRYRDFPLYRAPQTFINAASQSMPVLMMAAFFGPLSAGLYALGNMVMGVPSNLIGKAVGDVFYPRVAEIVRNGGAVYWPVVQATGILAVIGVLPFGMVVLYGPQIFAILFGVNWVLAGEYAQWLSLFYFFNFINKPCVALVPIIEIQRGLLVYEVLSTGAKAFALFAGFYLLESARYGVALFSIVGSVAYGVMMAWIIFRAARWASDEQAGR